MKPRLLLLLCLTFAYGTVVAEVAKTVNNADETKSFVTVDVVELILKYRIAILKMLYGALTEEGLVVGQYLYGDQKYSIHTFALCEKYARQHNIKQPTLFSVLQEAKSHFITQTREFLASVSDLRTMFFQLLSIDGTRKSGKQFSFLWGGKRDELSYIEEEMQSFQDLEQLLVNILEVLNSLLEISPKATSQCYGRIEKWQKIRGFLDELEKEGCINESFDKISFLRFIKYNYLDVLLLGEFTKDQVEIILHEYMFTHT